MSDTIAAFLRDCVLRKEDVDRRLDPRPVTYAEDDRSIMGTIAKLA